MAARPFSAGREQPRRSLLSTPALQALLGQIGALATILLLFALLRASLGTTAPSWLLLATLQGALAAALTWRRLASWWRPIQFLFPIAAVAVSSLQIPSGFFLGGFVLLLALYWSSFRTQVPFYPSGRAARDAVHELLPSGPVHLIDVGSGFGGLVLDLARCRPDSRFAGIELAPLPWLVSRVRAALSRSSARFRRGDYEHLNFGDYDLVFAYLSPAAMPALWRKARREMRPDTLLLSCEFEIDGVTPDITIELNRTGLFLYGWRMPALKKPVGVQVLRSPAVINVTE